MRLCFVPRPGPPPPRCRPGLGSARGWREAGRGVTCVWRQEGLGGKPALPSWTPRPQLHLPHPEYFSPCKCTRGRYEAIGGPALGLWGPSRHPATCVRTPPTDARGRVPGPGRLHALRQSIRWCEPLLTASMGGQDSSLEPAGPEPITWEGTQTPPVWAGSKVQPKLTSPLEKQLRETLGASWEAEFSASTPKTRVINRERRTGPHGTWTPVFCE